MWSFLNKILILTIIIQLIGLFDIFLVPTKFSYFNKSYAQSPTSWIFTVYRETTWNQTIWTSAVDIPWDTLVTQHTEIPIMTGSTDFDLSVWGHYLVMYSIPVRSSGWANRSEVQSWLRLNGSTNLEYWRASSYIRRMEWDDDWYNEWAAVIDVSAWDNIKVQMQRTGSNSATVQTTPDRSWINLLKLDDLWSYARLKPTGSQTITTSWTNVDITSEDEIDSPWFTRTWNSLTLSEPWNYLVTYNVWIQTTNTMRTNDETRLVLDWTEVEWTLWAAYIRWDQWTNNGVSSFVWIINTSSADQVLNLQVKRESTNEWTWHSTIANQTALSVTKLPDSADYVRIAEVAWWWQDITTSANTPLNFDTTREEDSTFDHNASSESEIDIKEDGDYLFFHSVYNSRSDVSNWPRESPFLEWQLNWTNLKYGTSGSYNRQSNDWNWISNSSHSSAWIIIPSLTSTWTIRLTETNEATAWLATYKNNKMALQWVNIDSLFTKKPFMSQIHYRWKDNSADFDTSLWWLAAENTQINNITKWENLRLRMSVANIWDLTFSGSTQLKMQWWDAVWETCSSISTWNNIDNANDPWEMLSTSEITPNWETSSVALMNNTESYTHLLSEWYDASSWLSSLTWTWVFTPNSYKEYEFSLSSTPYAVTGHKYCFRLYNSAESSPLDSYNYPELTIDSKVVYNDLIWWEAWKILAPANGWWTTLAFSWTNYQSPVIVWRTNTYNDWNEALVFESRNVTNTWAQVRLCDSNAWNSTWCQTHLQETIGYVVVDSAYTDNIDWIDSGSFVADESFDTIGWLLTINYSESFTVTPYVFTSIQTTSWDSPIVTRVESSSTTNFTTGICQQNWEDTCNPTHPNETVWWIAIEPWFDPFWWLINELGSWNSTSPSNIWVPVVFTETYSSPPVAISQAVTNNWWQDVQIDEIKSVTNLGMDYRSCELDNDDDCDTHNTDTVRWLAIEEWTFIDAIWKDNYLDQTNYRWYQNSDSLSPGSSLAAENAQIWSLPVSWELRLRMLLQNWLKDLEESTLELKLQYKSWSICTGASWWNDLWNGAWWEDWLMINNPTPVNGTQITSSLLFWWWHILQNYSEINPSFSNPNIITPWNWWEWDFVIKENWVPALSNYCFRAVTEDDELLNYSTYPFINLNDSTSPTISAYSPWSWALLPIWNFDIDYSFSDLESWINTSSENIIIRKWNWIAWWVDISWTGSSLSSINSTWAIYNITWLEYWKYQVTFAITDNAWNSWSQVHIFYVDEIEFIISSPEIDIGNIFSSNNLYTSASDLTITVKTVWAWFDVIMKKNTQLQMWSINIPDYDGTKWYWYDLNPYIWTPTALWTWNNSVWSESKNININGNKNTYTYNVKYSAILDEIEDFEAWEYEWTIDFWINLNYN